MTASNKKIIFSFLLLLLALLVGGIFYLVKQDKKVTDSNKKVIGDVKSNIVEDLKNNEEDTVFVFADKFFGEKKEEEENFIDFNEEPEKEKLTENKPIIEEDDKIFIPELEHVLVESTPEPKVLEVVQSRKREIKKKNEYTSIAQKNIPKKPEILDDKEIFPNVNSTYPNDLSRIVTTSTFIPAVMYTAVNSEIPSKSVLAIVESDVFGFHGDNILIPKGSKIEGVYERLEDKHARRMQITWFQITRPDGVIIKLDAESGDQQGAGGLGGYLDQRLKDRYGAALMLSGINALAQMSVNENDVRQLAAVESFGREGATLTAQIIRENINILPVIMIRQGTRFNIRPFQNIYFPLPKNNRITAKVLQYENNP